MGETDEEVICGWMEPRPSGSLTNLLADWWLFRSVNAGWVPRTLTLDRLWNVEERLTEKQRDPYLDVIVRNTGLGPTTAGWDMAHATAAQKIKALAEVLRSSQLKDENSGKQQPFEYDPSAPRKGA